MKKILAVVLALALVMALGAVSFADFEPDYEKTITLIVPQGAGGGTDTQARQLVEAMKQVSGFDNIIVENVTGGSTGIGSHPAAGDRSPVSPAGSPAVPCNRPPACSRGQPVCMDSYSASAASFLEAFRP